MNYPEGNNSKVISKEQSGDYHLQDDGGRDNDKDDAIKTKLTEDHVKEWLWVLAQ
jgi:hypothetical protein